MLAPCMAAFRLPGQFNPSGCKKAVDWAPNCQKPINICKIKAAQNPSAIARHASVLSFMERKTPNTSHRCRLTYKDTRQSTDQITLMEASRHKANPHRPGGHLPQIPRSSEFGGRVPGV